MKYYGKTHRHPNSTFEYTRSSLTELMTWDATDDLKLINVPLLMMAGSAADSLYLTEDTIEKATGTNDKELKSTSSRNFSANIFNRVKNGLTRGR